MSTKTLTQEQLDQLPAIIAKWAVVSQCTDRVNFEEAKAAAIECYLEAGLTPPKEWYFYPDPYTAAIQVAHARFQHQSEAWSRTKFKEVENAAISDMIYGNHEAGWLAYYEAFLQFGVKECEALVPLMNLAKVCGWWMPYENLCVLIDRPTVIHIVDKVLHCETGPAVRYAGDNYTMYCLHGVEMKEWHVMTPAEKIDAKKVLEEENAEVRKELIRKIGVERFIQAAGARVIHKQGKYELLSVDIADSFKGVLFLKMQNPSVGVWHVECVHPDCKTVQHAINWRKYGDINKEWNPAVLT